LSLLTATSSTEAVPGSLPTNGVPPETVSAPGTAPKLTQWSLEELTALKVDTVYGASRHEQLETEAPSSVTVVSAQDVKKYGYRTLADLLQAVRGMYVTYDRGYTYIGIRGMNRPGDFGGRVLIAINGHRLNDPIYDQAVNGTEFPLDVDLIDHVEVIRGPGSSLYGNNAFFTVINVITAITSSALTRAPPAARPARRCSTRTGAPRTGWVAKCS
jgi:iron complex outermembrane receptor protein